MIFFTNRKFENSLLKNKLLVEQHSRTFLPFGLLLSISIFYIYCFASSEGSNKTAQMCTGAIRTIISFAVAYVYLTSVFNI